MDRSLKDDGETAANAAACGVFLIVTVAGGAFLGMVEGLALGLALSCVAFLLVK